VSINGRMLTRANADEVMRMIAFWEERALLEANPGGVHALVQYGDPNGPRRNGGWD
jgi:hypothetical protein